MPDQDTASVQDPLNNVSELRRQFLSASEKKQLQLVPQLVSAGNPGLAVLQEYLRSCQSVPTNLVVGKVYLALYQSKTPEIQEFLQAYFPEGIVSLETERNINYQLLQHLLIEQDFRAADSLTRQKLCELAGEAALKRKWLYFTEVEQFPAADLSTIDRLWQVYSEGKFGFSVQRQIWLSVGKDFSKVWPKIGWKTDNNWTQYPNGFTWNLSAPKGHLPLSNQLRGVRVIASLFSHPVWAQNSST